MIGMVGIRQQKTNFMLWGTFVRTSFRGRNIGNDLVEKAVEKISLSHREIQQISLEVFSSAQAARALYKKLGFIETESRSTGEIVLIKSLSG